MNSRSRTHWVGATGSNPVKEVLLLSSSSFIFHLWKEVNRQSSFRVTGSINDEKHSAKKTEMSFW